MRSFYANTGTVLSGTETCLNHNITQSKQKVHQSQTIGVKVEYTHPRVSLKTRDLGFKVREKVLFNYQDMDISQDKCTFIQAGAIVTNGDQHSHSHGHTHEHGHTHDVLDNPGTFTARDQPIYRADWKQRSFTVGIGGPVGSGKTALVLALCKHLRDSNSLCVVTNDIFTREDWEFLVRNKALPEERMRAVETGGCPHAAIREDFSLNIEEVKELTQKYQPDLVIIESGGDNLAANFSRELADYIIYVIDVAGGDKIPRKGGPGITQSDLLVINKTDLADAVGADLKVMDRDAKLMRQDGPTIFSQAKHMIGIPEIADLILKSQKIATQSGI